jgi:asparagine synthase (glutamine-hydrolysing)
MCGIAGLIGVSPEVAREIAPRLLEALRHRGPDDHGITEVPDPQGKAPPAILVHRRLSILDLSPAGHQPMQDHPADPKEKPNWIVYNCEIFNFADLHPELRERGWPCRTRCDTEVILNGYRVWGESCVEQFRGMFAWCLMDTEQGIAWFARDRLGIKPLYFCRPEGGGLIFASEVRSILAAGPEMVPPHVSRTALESFLAQGAVFGYQSIIDGIQMLEPGESMFADWSGNIISRRKYWQIPSVAEDGNGDGWHGSKGRKRAVEELHETLRRAVDLRMISDVPLGLFLSGGIDSGGLATVATEVAGHDVQTISIGFDQPEFDETDAARAVAQQLGTKHRAIQLTGQDMLSQLPKVLAAIDQPTVDGFNTYFVSGAARQAGLTVALSGLGGDELFGGYASFTDVPRALKWRNRLRWTGHRGIDLLSELFRKSGRRSAVKAAEMLARDPSVVQMYLLRRELFLRSERRELHLLPEGSDPSSGMPSATVAELIKQTQDLDVPNQLSRLESTAYMRHMLLRDADVFSMIHGLEVRVPLLDHKLVELIATMPGSWKRPDPRPKPLLIDAVGPRLPQSVYTTPKKGFTFPWDAWLRGPLQQRAAVAMNHASVWRELGLHPSAPPRLWRRFLSGDRRVAALQVLAMVVLEDFATRHKLRSPR